MYPPNNPIWWTHSHTASWENIKSALQRDWQQTKSDLSSHGRPLNQCTADTLKQALGQATLPPPFVQTDQEDVRWHEAEREVRYGYAVRSQYPQGHEWDAQLESRLQAEWDMLTPEHPFRFAKEKIRRGWDYASCKP